MRDRITHCYSFLAGGTIVLKSEAFGGAANPMGLVQRTLLKHRLGDDQHVFQLGFVSPESLNLLNFSLALLLGVLKVLGKFEHRLHHSCDEGPRAIETELHPAFVSGKRKGCFNETSRLLR